MATTQGPDDVEANRDGRITFQDDLERGRTPRAARLDRSRSRRSRSRESSISRRAPASPYSGVQIGYRTLSIQVAESRAIEDSVDLKNVEKKADQVEDYFANIGFHKLDTATLCQQLNVNETQGLSGEAAARRLERDGPNSLPKARTNYVKKLLMYLFGGFCSVLWIGVIIFFLSWKPLSDPPSATNLALAILVIIVILLQAGFSGFQDWSTARTMQSILDLLPSETQVIRDGTPQRIKVADLVVGDIVQLRVGDKVPADLRLLSHSGDIRFDRAILTGESDEIEGAVDMTDPNFLESRNVALMGTLVVNGNGTGVVILTGGGSVMGRIADATANVKEVPTLIQREITRFVYIIVCFTIMLALLILLVWVGWLRVDHPSYLSVVAMLNNVMGCVVAFIPEGMPVAVALTFLMVARRMKNNNILPKGLSTVETLGCVTVICSDKTGTLTKNEMTVNSVAFVDGLLPSPDTFHTKLDAKDAGASLHQLFRAATLCNDASFDPTTQHLPVNQRKVQGNATDAAVLKFTGLNQALDTLKATSPRIFEIPFNSKNKWMLTLFRQDDSAYQVIMKGAPDVLLPACTGYWSYKSNEVLPLDAAARSSFKAIQDQLSSNAERVIVLCEKTVRPTNSPGTNSFSDEIAAASLQDLIIVGIIGIVDPPRAETPETVAAVRRGGSRFFMVTGDYGLTAAAIARNIGIFTSQNDPDSLESMRERHQLSADPEKTPATVPKKKSRKERQADVVVNRGTSLLLEGPSIAQLQAPDWDVVCAYEEIVFARTTPEQKLRIVNELRARNNVVAVTGDGVNDAPALRAADVGVAVVSGSDVAIDAADLVLLDTFDSIVDAIRQGRLVFQNLQKVIAYLLPAGSWSEIWPVLLNVFLGVPLPLSSFLMIIICVFTDLFLSLSLVMEKEEFDLMASPPRNTRRDRLINGKIYLQAYLFLGTMETITAHSMFFLYMWRHAGIPVSELFLLFEGYSEGFHGYTAAELAHFNAVGQSVYFVSVVILQWGNILAVRNRRLSLFEADPFTKKRRNPWLLLSILISLVIAIFVTEVPGIQDLFGTAPVPIEFWLIPVPLALGILSMDEIRKLLVRLFPNGILAKIAW